VGHAGTAALRRGRASACRARSSRNALRSRSSIMSSARCTNSSSALWPAVCSRNATSTCRARARAVGRLLPYPTLPYPGASRCRLHDGSAGSARLDVGHPGAGAGGAAAPRTLTGAAARAASAGQRRAAARARGDARAPPRERGHARPLCTPASLARGSGTGLRRARAWPLKMSATESTSASRASSGVSAWRTPSPPSPSAPCAVAAPVNPGDPRQPPFAAPPACRGPPA